MASRRPAFGDYRASRFPRDTPSKVSLRRAVDWLEPRHSLGALDSRRATALEATAAGPERAAVASRLARSTHARREVQHGVKEVAAPAFGRESVGGLSKRIGVRIDAEEPGDQRRTFVSTATVCSPKACIRTERAVYSPTPCSESNAVRSAGTLPAYRSHSCAEQRSRCPARFVRPRGSMASTSRSEGAATRHAGVGYRATKETYAPSTADAVVRWSSTSATRISKAVLESSRHGSACLPFS